MIVKVIFPQRRKATRIGGVQNNSIFVKGALCPKRIMTGALEFTGLFEHLNARLMPGQYRSH